MAMDDGRAMETEGKQVQVRFTTKLPPSLRVTNTPFMLGAHLKRYGLSEVVNTLLGLDNPKPFDFLVDGELLRTSLGEVFLSKKLSTENIVTIEYIPAVPPPQLQAPHVHADWVSSVDGTNSRFVITGSYDSSARAWRAEGTCVATFSGHKNCITAVVALPELGNDDLGLVTASKDRTLMLWQAALPKDEALAAVQPLRVFKGHKSSVQTVAASPSGNEICSGSWDCSIKLWLATGEGDQDADPGATKRRRLGSKGGAFEEHHVQEIAARKTFEGHTQCVSSVDWKEQGSIHSVSWDHSLRNWDVETGVNSTTLTCKTALHCLSVGGEGSTMLAAGGADNVLRIWDPRMPGVVTPALQLSGPSAHKAWITACKWHRASRHHLLSASHDGTVKLWDTRSKSPLHTLVGHKDKVLSADWWKEDCLVSGGADSKLRVFSDVQLYKV